MQSPPKPTVALCLVVFNELGGCKIDVPQLPKEHFNQIYAVDGGSKDGTVEYLESQGIPAYRQPKRSLNAAYHHAVERCECDNLVIFFPKGTITPTCTAEISRLLASGHDLVVASRSIPGAVNEEDAHFFKPRKWGVGALSWTASILWRREGWRIRDVLHGVKGFRVAAFKRMQISEIGVTIDLEMTVRAYRLRIPRAEFPVSEIARPHGETNFKIWPTAKKLGKFLLHELVHDLPEEPAKVSDFAKVSATNK